MQFIESSVVGVRAAILRLRSPSARCTYTLIPMVHVGELAFYEEVRRELEGRAYVLYEGVRHPFVERMSRNFEIAAGSPRIGLVTQREALAEAARSGEWIHIDTPADIFERHWRRLPLWMRVTVKPLSVLIFLHMRWFGDRRELGRVLPIADLRSRQEIYDKRDNATKPDAFSILVDERDRHIVAMLERVHQRIQHTDGSAAILFGATHMRAIARYFIEHHGYQVRESRWVTVFGWDTLGRA
ncbi:MAG: hypothetical protein AB7J30_20895 [Hyphomicrobium sp.]|uniref:hypothetical protein n=1 Tax=Hyphomicrobium sp. TaxID=82 RepID=UPI003D151BCE